MCTGSSRAFAPLGPSRGLDPRVALLGSELDSGVEDVVAESALGPEEEDDERRRRRKTTRVHYSLWCVCVLQLWQALLVCVVPDLTCIQAWLLIHTH